MFVHKVVRIMRTLWEDIHYYDALEVAHTRLAEELVTRRRQVRELQSRCALLEQRLAACTCREHRDASAR